MTDASTTALVTVNPRARAVVTFPVKGDPWPTIAAWAQKHRFLPRAPQTGEVKLFQKGSGLWTSPMRAQFTKKGDVIELQAWVHNLLFTRLMMLFLIPTEITVASGGFKLMVPRSMARKAVNELLGQFRAPPIP